MIRLAQGDPESAREMLASSREALDTSRVPSDPSTRAGVVAEWAQEPPSDARSAVHRPDDYELVLMLTLEAVSEIASGKRDPTALLQAQKRQDEILAAYDQYDVPETYKITRAKYELVSLPYYLHAALLESSGGQACTDAYRRVEEIEARQGNECSLAQEMSQRFERADRFPEGGAVHVVAFLGRGPKKIEKTDILPTSMLSAVSKILSAWGLGKVGVSDYGVVTVPFPSLETRPRELTGFRVRALGSETTGSVITDLTSVAQSQFEARRPWVYAQAVVPRILKSIPLEAEASGAEESGGMWAGLSSTVVSFASRAFWSYSDRADTRCWTTLPDTIQAVRVDLPVGRHTLKLSAVDSTNTAGAVRDVDVTVERGRSTFVFVFFNSLTGEPAVINGRGSF